MNRTHERRAEIIAGGVFAALLLGVVVGWCARPEPNPAVHSRAPRPGTGDLTYTAVTASGAQVAVTATIIGFLIVGAALIGLFFYSPRPAPTARRRPRRSGAAEPIRAAIGRAARYFAPFRLMPYSSSAPGAVFETCMRNSTLLLDFFNRSISRSIA
ncbi:hypothetical protein [Nocardia sp. CC227C]|uniref:hypothetical protein n=1 Tax=Nocardia sp. CC227C TaxID=3044562 RepID=UPI00278C7E06|nr:hypothetical protein [Nocardia sp. CC227C]